MAKIKVMPTPAKEAVPMPDGRGAAGQAVLTDSAAPTSRPAPSLRPAAAVPDPEVPEKAARRRFTAEYKLRILREAEGCETPGVVGALLRREGLYSSHLTTWRQQQDQGALAALSPRVRGRRAAAAQPLVRRIAGRSASWHGFTSDSDKLRRSLRPKKNFPRSWGCRWRRPSSGSAPDGRRPRACPGSRHGPGLPRPRRAARESLPAAALAGAGGLAPPAPGARPDGPGAPDGVALLHSERFVDQAPAEVYATLLDEGTYHCSPRTMYRLLAEAQEVRERRNQLRHVAPKPELLATGPNQVWSWDITKLLGPAKWTYFSLYVILDIFSRYVVGWMVAHQESATLAERHHGEVAGRAETGGWSFDRFLDELAELELKERTRRRIERLLKDLPPAVGQDARDAGPLAAAAGSGQRPGLPVGRDLRDARIGRTPVASVPFVRRWDEPAGLPLDERRIRSDAKDFR